jgi:hypothetical protein
MITRRIVLSRAALGAAALVSSVGLLGAPVLAENGNGNGNDPVLQRRRERRRERKERRRERRRNNGNNRNN